MKCLFVALVFVISAAVVNTLPCDSGWSFYKKGNKCIKLFKDNRSWQGAGAACKKQGGRLVAIPDLSTQLFVNKILGTAAVAAWIGLNDIGKENVYKWSDGSEACEFQYWLGGEPNNQGNEDCVHLFAEPHHHWNDRFCSRKTPYICEKKGPGCKYKNGGCPGGGVCTQKGWNVKCSCKTGLADYHGTCTDVNECSIKNGGCDQICENTVGSFQCQCYTDFVYNGKKCVLDNGETIVG